MVWVRSWSICVLNWVNSAVKMVMFWLACWLAVSSKFLLWLLLLASWESSFLSSSWSFVLWVSSVECCYNFLSLSLFVAACCVWWSWMLCFNWAMAWELVWWWVVSLFSSKADAYRALKSSFFKESTLAKRFFACSSSEACLVKRSLFISFFSASRLSIFPLSMAMLSFSSWCVSAAFESFSSKHSFCLEISSFSARISCWIFRIDVCWLLVFYCVFVSSC